MPKPLQRLKRKLPHPAIRLFQPNLETGVFYAGRKISYPTWFKRARAIKRMVGHSVEDQYIEVHRGPRPKVFGSFGQLSFSVVEKRGLKIGEVNGVGVRDFFRNHGLATRLYKKLEEYGRRQGLDELETFLAYSIEPQVTLLKKLGWEESGNLGKRLIYRKKLK